MNSLQNFVNWKLTHADKTAEASGYPLVMDNCKANKKMKQLKVYGNSVQDGTPTPEEPIEVQSVGEPTVNLFDVNTIEVWKVSNAKDITITDNGVSYIADGSYGNVTIKIGLASDYVGKTLTLSTIDYYSTATQLLLFNGDTVSKTGTVCKSNNNGLYYTTLTINEGDCADGVYLCIRLYYQSKAIGDIIEYSNIMMVEGSTATPYEPYGKYKIPILAKGVNLFDISKYSATIQTINCITFTPLGDERIHIKGKLEDTTKVANYKVAYKTKTYIKQGTYRAKSNKYSNKGVTVQFNISNGSSAVNISANNASNSVTFDNGYISFAQIYISGTDVEFDDVIELQLTTGTENLPYEPYVEPITTNVFLNEPLGKRGNYADYIDFAFKEACHYNVEGTPYMYEALDITLPKLTAKTTIIEVDTSLAPSNAYGKYIKK